LFVRLVLIGAIGSIFLLRKIDNKRFKLGLRLCFVLFLDTKRETRK